MNHCNLIGNLTRAPESGKTPGGILFCRFTLAVNRAYKGADGERQTDFVPVVAWRGLAELCFKYLEKGRKVAVTGELQTRVYEDKDRQRRTAFEIVAGDVEFLSNRPKPPQAPPLDDFPEPVAPPENA